MNHGALLTSVTAAADLGGRPEAVINYGGGRDQFAPCSGKC